MADPTSNDAPDQVLDETTSHQPDTDAALCPFVGRSHGVITASPEDLITPIDVEWEVETDL